MKSSPSSASLMALLCCVSLLSLLEGSKYRGHELEMLKYRNHKMRREIERLKRSKWQHKNRRKLHFDHMDKRRKSKIRNYLKNHPMKNMHFKKKLGKKASRLQKSKKFQMGYIHNFNQGNATAMQPGAPLMNGAAMGGPGQWSQGYSPRMQPGMPMATGTSMMNPAIMGGSFNKFQMPNRPQQTAAPKVLDSVITQESPKQTFQQNMADYAQRVKKEEINDERN